MERIAKMLPITEEQAEEMRRVPEFADSAYGFLSPIATLEYFWKRHIRNLAYYCDLSNTLLLDCGCGFGWNSLAFLLAGGRAAIGIDLELPRLRAGRQFAKILGVEHRVLLCQASITALPCRTGGVSATMAIEVLEHLFGQGDTALGELARVTQDVILITTPNAWCPIIAHDTRLPFAHWLPGSLRRRYASAFRRSDRDEDNTFITPRQVIKNLEGFRLVSRFLGYPSFQDYCQSYPHYLPYLGAGYERNLPRVQRLIYKIVDHVGRRASFYVLPSLAGVFVSNRKHEYVSGNRCIASHSGILEH